jgi:L-malate glycosyltransferase
MLGGSGGCLALENSSNLRLVVAGDGIEQGSLARLTAEPGVADRVIFTGYVAPEAVLGTFDIFALSSDTEQMPSALLEAMAASRAIAAVDVGDVKNIVCDDNRSFIVARDDDQAFAGAIARLLGDPVMRAELGRKNCECVVAEFSQEQMFVGCSPIFGSAAVRGMG